MADRYSVVFTKHQLAALENSINGTLEDLEANAHVSTSKSRGMVVSLTNCLEAIRDKKTVRN